LRNWTRPRTACSASCNRGGLSGRRQRGERMCAMERWPALTGKPRSLYPGWQRLYWKRRTGLVDPASISLERNTRQPFNSLAQRVSALAGGNLFRPACGDSDSRKNLQVCLGLAVGVIEFSGVDGTLGEGSAQEGITLVKGVGRVNRPGLSSLQSKSMRDSFEDHGSASVHDWLYVGSAVGGMDLCGSGAADSPG